MSTSLKCFDKRDNLLCPEFGMLHYTVQYTEFEVKTTSSFLKCRYFMQWQTLRVRGESTKVHQLQKVMFHLHF